MPRRPPKKWLARVVKKLTFHPRVYDPQAVAGWMWANWLKPETRRRILATENPRVYQSQIEAAIEKYLEVHGKAPTKASRVEIPDPPQAVTLIGELIQVNYRTTKNGGPSTEYYHRFKRPRPKLVTDPKGKNLFVVGGKFKISERGIEG